MANLERLRQAELLGQQKRAGLVAADARIPEREQQTIQKLGATPEAVSKLDPVTLFEATYTSDELKNIPAYQQALLNQSSSLTKQAYADKEQAQANLLATDKPTASKLRVLEDAIRTKAGIGQESIGTSETYDKLGISGYATLLQSLNQRGTEMNNRYNSFVDKFTSVSQGIKDQYSVVADKYKLLKNEYDKEVERFDKITYQISAQQHAMNMLERQDELNKEAREWQLNNPGAATSLNFDESGKAWVDGKVVDKPAFTPTGNYETVTYNGRPITVDSVATSSLAEINKAAEGISVNGKKGLVIGAVEDSSFRTTEQQKALHDKGATKLDGTKAKSQHQSGLAIDLFPDKEYIEKIKPIMEAKGWKQTLPGSDPGHFVYVGQPSGTTSLKQKKGEAQYQWENRLLVGFVDKLTTVAGSGEIFDGKKDLDKIAKALTMTTTELRNVLLGKEDEDGVPTGGILSPVVAQMYDRYDKELAAGNADVEKLVTDLYNALGGLIDVGDIIASLYSRTSLPAKDLDGWGEAKEQKNLAALIKKNNPNIK